MSLIAKMHVARKQLGLDEDTYRDALEKVTGKRSAKEMSDGERLSVIKAFEAAGFNPRPASSRPSSGPSGHLLPANGGAKGSPRRKLTGKYAGKLQALWIAGWNLGLVKNRDDAALLAFVKRQTGIDHVRFLRDGDDALKAIEALKAWLARAGVDWTTGAHMQNYQQLSGFKIATAQFAKLAAASCPPSRFGNEVHAITGRMMHEMLRESDWHGVMNAFGERVRAAKKAVK